MHKQAKKAAQNSLFPFLRINYNHQEYVLTSRLPSEITIPFEASQMI